MNSSNKHLKTVNVTRGVGFESAKFISHCDWEKYRLKIRPLSNKVENS
jgi:hypothetical protein